jgi:hypothetical protein
VLIKNGGRVLLPIKMEKVMLTVGHSCNLGIWGLFFEIECFLKK